MTRALLSLSLIACISSTSHAEEQYQYHFKTAPFSEEQGEAKCPTWYALHGIQCYGDYCDNKVLFCLKLNQVGRMLSSHFLSGTFSEELPNNQQTVPGPGVITGLRCSGDYCDNLQITVSEYVTEYGSEVYDLTMGKGRWTEPFSEERMGPMLCGPGEFVTGIRCLGDYCDNLQLQCNHIGVYKRP